MIGMGTVERNALIDDALAKGAKLVCGEKATSTLMPATVLDHVTPAMRIYREETFGPAKCSIARVNGIEEAVACANDNDNDIDKDKDKDKDYGPCGGLPCSQRRLQCRAGKGIEAQSDFVGPLLTAA